MSQQSHLRDQRIDELREACEGNLFIFACTVEPHRCYGRCHEELYNWWQYQEADGVENTLALLPRDHQKSHCAAVWSSWQITLNPATTIIYLSATTELATRQLDDIKQILEAKPHRTLWPDMIDPVESKREMWNNDGIKVDHPDRKKEGVRDPTVSIAGMTTNTTGWHCNILVKDDVVIPENAYTREGRMKVERKCSQMSSVLTTGGLELVVGTRYHPDDHYNTIKEMHEDIFDDNDEVVDQALVYSVFERQVEVEGVFLWPRKARQTDGKMFGFDLRQLARKKAKYVDRRQYYAQYYNNPNNSEDEKIDTSMFMYYDPRHLHNEDGDWYIGDKILNLYCGMDFAYSKSSKADWTAIVVIGVDEEGNIYILYMHRFRTDRYANYYAALETQAIKWGFRRALLETTAAQIVIANYIRDKLVENNIPVRIDHHKPSSASGSKEERMEATLNPRYEDQKIYHYRSGIINMLEEELRLEHPPHDDLKDVLAAVISWDKVKPARKLRQKQQEQDCVAAQLKTHSRFGGAV